MSEQELAVTDEREACARECDACAQRFRTLASGLPDGSWTRSIANEKAFAAEGLAVIIRGRAVKS